MIRIICRDVDVGAACNVGGPVYTTWKTWDVELPQIEGWLRAKASSYNSREIVGFEVIDTPLADKESQS